jgi:arylsulfatase
MRGGRHEYNFAAHERYRIAGSEALPPGPAVIRVDFKYDGGGIGKGGVVTLFVNDRKVGEGRIDKTVPSRFGAESFDVGMDNGSPVSENYQPPFAYRGTIKKVQIRILPSALSANDQEKVRHAARKAAMALE